MRNLSMQESIFRHLPNVRGHEPMIVRQFRLMGKILRKTLPSMLLPHSLNLSIRPIIEMTHPIWSMFRKTFIFPNCVFLYVQSTWNKEYSIYGISQTKKLCGDEKKAFSWKTNKVRTKDHYFTGCYTLIVLSRTKSSQPPTKIYYRGTILRLLQ